ncbi:U32 family peptidase C-terminal domain-containing protein [Gracilibacillus saliphilus]|uniref:U32 family peptidase C-terminal domain-containing protein n=1 Tax=Gracilibacillus saliphilus TaxID=543890 RepID=UPI001EE2CB3A|nr:U32 family peptidase C-terminal domain-containing protein [Gracilibacillus saliphilus]
MNFSDQISIGFQQKITWMVDENGKSIDIAKHPMMKVRVKVDKPVRYFNMMRKQR